MTRCIVVDELRSTSTATPSQSTTRQTRLRVLLIDDEIEQLLPLADVLHRAGFVPTIATSDDEALFDVETSPPDVVVVDAEMVDRSLLARLRALISKLPLVLVIGAPTDAPRIAATLATAGVAYIEKPVKARELLDLLSDASRFSG